MTIESICRYFVTLALLCWLTADLPIYQILLLTGGFCFLHHCLVALKYLEQLLSVWVSLAQPVTAWLEKVKMWIELVELCECEWGNYCC